MAKKNREFRKAATAMNMCWMICCLLLAGMTITFAEPDQDHEIQIQQDRSKIVTDHLVREETRTSNIQNKRKKFPEKEPLVCLAFLSCCGRTHLLKHTLSGIIQHMEHDEPSDLRYEIAWVDNGSGPHLTQEIMEQFEVEHVLPLPQNLGLAFGMNALIQNLCTAPYILLLEEDWLYLDQAVADQTQERKSAISRALALTMAKPETIHDNRSLIGVQLREKPGFLQPLTTATLTNQILPGADTTTDIEYYVYCMDLKKTGTVFGSYTNGAALYNRADLLQIGRMYGEPLDQFHDSYVETNYALRVGLKHCLGAIVLQQIDDTTKNDQSWETAAFQHIGGGHGTRPGKRVDVDYCLDDAWTFYGTPFYEQVKAATSAASTSPCKLPTIMEQLDSNLEYQKINAKRNEHIFQREKETRHKMLADLTLIKKYIDQPDILRQIPIFHGFTDQQIFDYVIKVENVAKSPHPLPGFWNNLGHPIEQNS